MQRSAACFAISNFAAIGCGRVDPRHAIAGRERLREAAQVDDAARSIVGAHRPDVRLGGRVLEVQIAVGIVFDDEDVAALGPLEQRRALAETDEQAGRILKVRHEVQHARAPALALQPHERVVELVEIDAVSVLADADQLGLRRCGTPMMAPV